MVVLVTGAKGQLGQAIQSIVGNQPSIDFVFCNSSELDITNLVNCEAIFKQYKPNFCINTAAYTAVDKAEIEPEKAKLINIIGAKNIAEVCKNNNTILLHISTDFIFDGNSKKPYTETDIPNPSGVYGKTKLDGEIAIQNTWGKHFIIRTSWVYSQFGNNFMKTIIRLGSEKDSLSVVNDQIGTPTYAVDLAEVLIQIILSPITNNTLSNTFGIYNFSNEGKCSWFDFASEILTLNNIKLNMKGIPTEDYPTPAKRPKYSVLDKTKITTTFGIPIKKWKESLKECTQLL
ncbi:dTDP-4-dehydrorhamnose reductase [Flavobacterium sp.]|jgi:dTDP-4-dehydrorhamnose reductase|uniref:dTDP-4-dehydrorhamnose reductase n=1 Tax=Flavobacterium sp. TaxID=239 RepID=UPI002A7F1BCD|nr:dTDP-4-dehydrorhamnose reductase [Flavobacterium sp.]